MKPAVVAYCLMTNHLHLVAVPQTKTRLARRWGRRISGTRDTSTACTAAAGNRIAIGEIGPKRVITAKMTRPQVLLKGDQHGKP